MVRWHRLRKTHAFLSLVLILLTALISIGAAWSQDDDENPERWKKYEKNGLEVICPKYLSHKLS
jgi:hypothetical protein